jgi:DNA-binding CsgD family transcriptional regulator
VEMQTRLGTAHMAGEIALAMGDLDRAWAEVSVLVSPAFRPIPGYDLPLLALAARVLAARRAAAGASPGTTTGPGDDERLLRRVLEHDAYWPSHPLWSALFEAELGGVRGTGTDEAAWQVAVDATALAGAPVHLVPYAHLRLGIAQVDAGDRAAALESLRAASVRAAQIGAGLLTAEVERVADRAGITLDGNTARRRLPRESPVLTARERQVLDLIDQGLSNRQIGEQLFISAKTASVHVSAILRKLGASSRTEAVFLARSEAAPATR